MRLYARSDLTAVVIPPDAGGCGSTHIRPVVQGAPAKLWPLDCPQCTIVLKEDPLWVMDRLKIPLTPDEASVAEEMEKRGDQVMHQVSAALAQNSIQAMRNQQQDSLDSSEAAQKQAAAEARYAALEEELARMKAMMTAFQQSQPRLDTTTTSGSASQNIPYVVTSLGSPQSAQDAPQDATGNSATVSTGWAATAPAGTTGACKTCGGPLRLKGQRGPTPKGTCMSCREKARRVA